MGVFSGKFGYGVGTDIVCLIDTGTLERQKPLFLSAQASLPMATVRVTSEVDLNLDQLLSGVAQLDTDELRNFVERVSLMLAQRKSASLPELEANLLQSINQGLPESTQHRYDVLQAKLQNEAIAPEEHQELLQLIDVVEQADADRLEALVELAQLRGVTLPDLMTQLGLRSPAVYA